MSDLPPYPPIEPATFDLIIIGTGLPESVISAAASAVGKSVLHLDPNPFYGSHFASLTIPDITSFLNSHSTVSSDDHDLTTRPLYSEVEISNSAPELLNKHSRKFYLDLLGPRALFCADLSVDLLLKSGASQYVEFKSIDASFVGDGDGKLWSVPDSRAAIFKDKSLGLMEKNQLMRFFKLVQGHLSESEHEDNNMKISEEDLEIPFVEFLTAMKLPQKIKLMILYAIAMADYDQENTEVSKDVLKTKDGINRLALYNSSVGRFQNSLGALIYPIYGQGELPQAFCRRAAVKGCIYVLRMPVISLLKDEESGSYKGVKLASGQDIFSNKLVLDPSFTVPGTLATPPSEQLPEYLLAYNPTDVNRKVARGICITKCSLKPNISNIMVVYPPKSLFPEQVAAIRVLQLGSNLAVCPSGMFVLYFSALCADADQGKKLLHATLNALEKLLDSENAESSSTIQGKDPEEVKPSILWSALYVQDLVMGQYASISSTIMPDGNLNYTDLLNATEKLFHKIYPNEEFFPETTSPDNSVDDAGLTLET
ncbi:rab escort protein 1 [Mangifera indica]|uniref:rab escort protein 1 n=1 Tax=Mangifera indica TaxID=29780 RepID=UPI001CF935BD|nr:rab escort protein 1 [Mangifera indica]XP_044470793.1 rab escort protein 1 [Mangifera indica]XP_044470794.1 rab escort protein 1 [Mangifera indica]